MEEKELPKLAAILIFNEKNILIYCHGTEKFHSILSKDLLMNCVNENIHATSSRESSSEEGAIWIEVLLCFLQFFSKCTKREETNKII